MALLWVAVIVSVAAVVASLVFLAVRTIRLWRGFRSFGGPITEALADVTASAEAAAVKGETLAGGSERMAHSLDRLARSRARLAVLSAAIADVRAAVEGLVPRK
jgi:hypothetical protein